MSSSAIPGLYYTFVRPPGEKSPLRTDIAGFFGFTKRGIPGRTVRVEGWREFASVFGGLVSDAMTSYAVRGYFDNWATTAHVVRLLGKSSKTAHATWAAGRVDPDTSKPDANWPGDSGLPSLSFDISASSPGAWSNGLSFTVRYWARAASGKPELEIQILPPDESAEILAGIHPQNIVEEVNQQSKYVILAPTPLSAGLTEADLKQPPGPRYFEWDTITLKDGDTQPPTLQQYLEAVTLLGDEAEVAMVIAPDLYKADVLTSPDDQWQVIFALLTQAAELHDRLVLIDVPPAKSNPVCALEWLTELRTEAKKRGADEHVLQNAAVYHPRIVVTDPLGTSAVPLCTIPNSGSVAGVMSRLDGQLGAYATPANAPLYESVDLESLFNTADQGALYRGGINLLKCSPNNGLLVWGGRVLGEGAASKPGSGSVDDYRGGFVAHRRLVHVLVRAFRSVAAPLVFDTNGPQLWLALVRSITSVLLAAYRAGALKGASPQEAFRVKCDAENNPPENMDNGLCMCEVQVAPAVPMEFITLRVVVSSDGKLEVFES